MSTASEQAAAFLTGAASGDRPGETRGATGDYARLRELLIEKDELTDDEAAELVELSDKRRSGALTGRPKTVVYKRQSVAGESDRDGDRGAPPSARTASEKAANFLRGL